MEVKVSRWLIIGLSVFCMSLWGTSIARGNNAGAGVTDDNRDQSNESQSSGQEEQQNSFHIVFLPRIGNAGDVPEDTRLRNGDFEAGRTIWEAKGSSDQRLIGSKDQLPLPPYQGEWAGILGGDPNLETMLQQTFIMQPGSSYLTYYLRVNSADYCSPNYDVGGVIVNDIVVDAYQLCGYNSTRGYLRRVIDLSAFAGQRITLRFMVSTDSSLSSFLLIDDITVTGAALGTSDPLPSEQNQAPLQQEEGKSGNAQLDDQRLGRARQLLRAAVENASR